MTTADPISPAFALVDSVLTADGTLMALVSGVFQDVAPVATYTRPWVIMQMQSAPVDTNTATGVRVLSRGILTVKVVGKYTDVASIRSAFARADALLCPNGEPRRVGDGNSGDLLDLYRSSTIAYSEIDSGIQYVHLGGQYRFEV